MSETDMRTVREIGETEPGFAAFAKRYRRQGTTPEALREYAVYLGAVRKLSPKPLLDLSVTELEELDEKLLAKSKSLRTVLKMFFRGNKRFELVEELPRQHREKERRLGPDDILMPRDVVAMIDHARSLRDCAIIATLAATGARINEILRLRMKDVRTVNGGSAYQFWFAQTKVKSQERFSPKVDGVWKTHLDRWLEEHPDRRSPEAWVFPSTAADGVHVADQTVADMLRSVAKKAGVRQAVHPHLFRHSRVSWGIMNHEDSATLSIGIWGIPRSTQLNNYVHFSGLEGADVSVPTDHALPDVSALPIPPVLSTQSQVAKLTDEVQAMRKIVEDLLIRDRISDPKAARRRLDKILAEPGAVAREQLKSG